MGKIQKFEQLAYLYIKNKILTNEWKPGYHIIELNISNDLDMSRSPVRSALAVLEKENIVEVIPYRGYFVLNKPSSEQLTGHKLRYFKIICYRLVDRLSKTDFENQRVSTLLYQTVRDLKQAVKNQDDSFFLKILLTYWEELFIPADHPFLVKEAKIAIKHIIRHIQDEVTTEQFQHLQTILTIYLEDLAFAIAHQQYQNCHTIIQLLSVRLLQHVSKDNQTTYLVTDHYPTRP